MAEWRNGIRTALVDRYGFTADNVRLFVDETVKTGEQGTAQNVRSALGTLRKQLTADDLLLIVFLGHGTFDGTVAKFNLIGPDLSAAEWGTLFNGLPGRLVVVNTTEASFPFLERLSAANRIVITATHSAAEMPQCFPSISRRLFKERRPISTKTVARPSSKCSAPSAWLSNSTTNSVDNWPPSTRSSMTMVMAWAASRGARS